MIYATQSEQIEQLKHELEMANIRLKTPADYTRIDVMSSVIDGEFRNYYRASNEKGIICLGGVFIDVLTYANCFEHNGVYVEGRCMTNLDCRDMEWKGFKALMDIPQL